jgi:hypothetical protein
MEQIEAKNGDTFIIPVSTTQQNELRVAVANIDSLKHIQDVSGIFKLTHASGASFTFEPSENGIKVTVIKNPEKKSLDDIKKRITEDIQKILLGA